MQMGINSVRCVVNRFATQHSLADQCIIEYCQDHDAFLFTDESIELYPNKELRYGDKNHNNAMTIAKLPQYQLHDCFYTLN